VLRRFSEDKVKPSNTPMVVHTLDVARDTFHSKEDEEEALEPEISYLRQLALYYTWLSILD